MGDTMIKAMSVNLPESCGAKNIIDCTGRGA